MELKGNEVAVIDAVCRYHWVFFPPYFRPEVTSRDDVT